MAKSANPGEMRTKIRILSYVEKQDENGYPVKAWESVFRDWVRCKCVNAHGNEAFEARRMELKEPKTLTMRYSPKVTETCEVYFQGDDRPFEIISLNDVENRHIWLEIHVQRKVSAK